MPVIVIGQFRMPPEKMAAARAPMLAVMAATRAEAGCIEYNYAEDLGDPGLIRVSELWENREQLTAHLQTAHMAVWAGERAALGLSGRAITVFAAGDGTAL